MCVCAFCWPCICCVVDWYYCCVVDRHCFFFLFLMIAVCTVSMSSAYFIMLSHRLPVTHTTCLHFDFLLDQTSEEYIILFFFFMWSRKELSRKQCVSHHLHCAPVAVGSISGRVKDSFEWRWTISVNVNEETHNHDSRTVNVNEETHNHDSRTPYISLVTALFTVYAQ